MGEYQTALERGQQAVAIADSQGLASLHVADALDAVAVAQQRLGRFDLAFRALQRAYEIRESLGARAEVVTSLTNIATLQALAGEYEAAREYFDRARPLAEALDRPVTLGRILINLSYTWLEEGRPEQALPVLEQARELAVAQDNPLLMAHAFHNTGEALVELGRSEDAADYLGRSLDLSTELGLQSVSADNHYYLGRVALADGRLERAQTLAEKALEIAQSIEENFRLRNVYDLLYRIAKAAGRSGDALAALETHVRYKDEVFNRENDRRRALLAAQFELSQKENEIELLKRDAEIQRLDLARKESLQRATVAGVVLAMTIILALAYSLWLRIRANRKIAEKARALTRTKRELEKANRAKSDFLAMTSHEVRTPLNGILGMTQLLLKTDLDDVQRKTANTILAAGQALLTILNDILDMSKIEAGRIELAPANFSPRELAARQDDLWRSHANAKGIDFTLEIDENLPETVHADANRIQQILFNLISNAIKFTDQGEIRVSVSAQSDGRGGTALAFDITDSGIGIPEDERKTLFEPYRQGKRALDGHHGGTGLGLHICRELVRRMNGDIGVESAPGSGSRFWFSVPVAPAEAEEAPPDTADNARPGAVQNRQAEGRALRLLVAEDNLINQRLIGALLDSWGYDYRIVSDGREAVDAVVDGDFDLVLMDTRMPTMTGLEASRAIRALQGPASRIPIIALTANATEGDRESFAAAGMDGYISKPIDIESLAWEIERLLGEETPEKKTLAGF